MTPTHRPFALLLTVLMSLCFSACFGHGTRRVIHLREEAHLPFLVNLAPGDVMIHGAEHDANTTDSYQPHVMNLGDRVVGQGGKLRSVILTQNESSVEVLQGTQLTAEMVGSKASLEVLSGTARVGRASFGDGSPIRTLLRTRRSLALLSGEDLLVSLDSQNGAQIRTPEPDKRYLFATRYGQFRVEQTSQSASTKFHERSVSDQKTSGHSASHHHHRHHRHHKHHRMISRNSGNPHGTSITVRSTSRT